MRGVTRLALAQARAERWQLPLWIAGISLLGFAAARAVAVEFDQEVERAGIIAVAAANPAFLFLRGLPDGTGIGPVAFFQGYAFTAVLTGLMSTFLIVRHTRLNEELGREELLSSSPVPRSASLGAALILAAVANILLAVTAAAGFAAAGLPVSGSLLAGSAIGAAGLFFAAAAALAAQVMPSARSANGAAASLVGAAYLLRGMGDALGTPDAGLAHVDPAWPSLLSPIGWGQRTRPFTAADPAPLLLLIIAALILAAAAVLVRERRDLGTSALPEREGRERAGAGGSSFLGLAWRLQRAALTGWVIGAAVLGAIAGTLAPVVAQTMAGNPSLTDLIARLVPGSRANAVEIFSTALLGIAGFLAAAAGVQAVLRMRAEETEGRTELLLAVPLPRTRWLRANLAVAALSVVAVAGAAGVTAAATLGMSGTTGHHPGILILAALAHVPAALVFAAAAAAVFALAPRLTVPLGWGLLAAGLVLGQFGELLRLPDWVQNLSPFRHSSALPVEELDVAAVFLLLLLALAAAGAATLLRRRDLTG